MKVSLRKTSKQIITCCLVLYFCVVFQPVIRVSAQTTETGSTTIETDAIIGMEVPPGSEQEQPKADEKKKDDRPRELGIMILIVWLLAGTGLGILIFTSLFGHSVRSMVRRPFPQQTQPKQQIPSETPPDQHDESEQLNEGPGNS